MTIQLSVLIWTIICFLLLMLILHNLLFKPVLQMIDKRKERIQNAASKKDAYEKQIREQEAMLQEKKAAFLAMQQKQMKEEIEMIRQDSKNRLETARVERLRKVDDYRIRVNEEQSELLALLGEHSMDLAVSFADSLIKE